jgi:ribonuclease R
MSEKPRKSFKQKQKKTFYKSVPKKNRKEKRNLENEIHGVYKQGQGNFGFVDSVDKVSWEKVGYFVHESKKLDAFEGDEVAIEVKIFKWRPEAVIKKVIKRSEHLIVGTLKIAKTYAFVISKNPLIKTDIFIPGKFLQWYSDGSQVAVQIIKWEWKNPEGRIIESLEVLPEGRKDIYRIAFEHWARLKFSERIKEELGKTPKSIPKEEIASRTDFRNMLTYTIDGVDSKDLDDGISIKRIESGYELYVHIADVAHYVKEDSHLDREARKRATSMYLCDQVIPMLPKEISNGLCSLHPWEDKLTLTCVIEVDDHGQIVSTWVFESIIHSDFRLTYDEVQQMTDGDIKVWDTLQFAKEISADLLENIKILEELKIILEKYKYKKGVLNFDFPETKIMLDEAGNPVEYKKYVRHESHKIIEECMVLANEAISRIFSKYPFLYRVHEDPDEADVEKFIKILEWLGAKELSENIKKQKLSPKVFQQILEHINSDPKLKYFQKLLLRSLQKARYSEKNFWHFGLALEYYSHFTSPIRRYPDLQIHRIIKEIVSKRLSHNRKDHYNHILSKVAARSSDREVMAEKAEYKVRDFMACKYMQDKVWQEFTGQISGMIEKWFFIELPDTIEWFIEFWFTGYQFDEKSYSIVGSTTWKQLHFWDEVPVRLTHIDEQRLRLEFEMA